MILKIGQVSFSEQDLVIPVNGILLTVVRTMPTSDWCLPAPQPFCEDASRFTPSADVVGVTRYSYTAAGLLQSEDLPAPAGYGKAGGPWADDTVSYTNRLRTSLSVQQPSASVWSQTYAYSSRN